MSVVTYAVVNKSSPVWSIFGLGGKFSPRLNPFFERRHGMKAFADKQDAKCITLREVALPFHVNASRALKCFLVPADKCEVTNPRAGVDADDQIEVECTSARLAHTFCLCSIQNCPPNTTKSGQSTGYREVG